MQIEKTYAHTAAGLQCFRETTVNLGDVSWKFNTVSIEN